MAKLLNLLRRDNAQSWEVQNTLIAYEFIDISDKRLNKDGNNHEFMRFKINYLSETFKDNFYLIQYNIDEDIYCIGKQHIKMNKDEFKEWFIEKNNCSNICALSLNSKPLGSATSNLGDPYVQKILQEIYKEKNEFKNVDFFNDDNGLMLVQNILNGENTYGFDFDLFESSENIVIEFLKRDSSFTTNLTAHPNRYLQNYHKFLSLWNAANLIKKEETNLFLVNYSDDPKEAINLIKVLEFNKEASSEKVGIISDISYQFSGYFEFLNWLKKLNNNAQEALITLENFPKEIRNNDFWKGFGDGKGSSAKEIKKRIGKNYQKY